MLSSCEEQHIGNTLGAFSGSIRKPGMLAEEPCGSSKFDQVYQYYPQSITNRSLNFNSEIRIVFFQTRCLLTIYTKIVAKAKYLVAKALEWKQLKGRIPNCYGLKAIHKGKGCFLY